MNRKQLAEIIEGYDANITALQTSKRETYDNYRIDLAKAGYDKDGVKAELEAFKLALRRKQAVKKSSDEAVTAQGELVDEIFVEITAARAPRATRVHVEIIDEFPSNRENPVKSDEPEHDADTGEVTSPTTTNGGERETAVREPEPVRTWRRRSDDPTSEGTPAHDMEVRTRPANAVEEPGRSLASTNTPTESVEQISVPIHPSEAALLPQTGGLISAPATVTGPVAVESPANHSQPNPICRDPGDCGVYASWHMPCLSCTRAAQARAA